MKLYILCSYEELCLTTVDISLLTTLNKLMSMETMGDYGRFLHPQAIKSLSQAAGGPDEGSPVTMVKVRQAWAPVPEQVQGYVPDWDR